ncbi:hypothetical protein HFO56_03260 [Rhizobium laguerreae]|uniref:hypothetical protein n=1 Tax=Rhizobium laguerreae TaxID=1076926 RepID=UPI001C91C995|nr:hypothetical protein [Rhizobium laguerreae]MBY3151406.1 hypothetical protein [Rhizobium laguerreae]
MAAYKGFPELVLVDGAVENLYRLETKGGKVVVGAYFSSRDDAVRLLDVWNACRKIAFPAAHLEATDDYCKRLEQLRKDAVARIKELDPDYGGA